jgi:hypothetical protein
VYRLFPRLVNPRAPTPSQNSSRRVRVYRRVDPRETHSVTRHVHNQCSGHLHRTVPLMSDRLRLSTSGPDLRTLMKGRTSSIQWSRLVSRHGEPTSAGHLHRKFEVLDERPTSCTDQVCSTSGPTSGLTSFPTNGPD